jgi:hypothetical protein
LLIECVFVADFYVVFGEVSGGFRAPGLWHRLIGWVIPDILKDCGAFIFIDHAVREELLACWRWRRCLSSKRQEALAQQHSVTSQTSWILSRTAVRTPQVLQRVSSYLMNVDSSLFVTGYSIIVRHMMCWV